jgi:hypothetical protein
MDFKLSKDLTMKRVILYILGILSISFMAFTSMNFDNNDCSILHKGTFIYGNPGNEIKVVIKGKEHIEYHNDGKYIIKSKLDWVNDCEYNMIMTKTTIPHFPYEAGDVMNVKIDSVKGNKVYYTSTVKGQSWKGKFTKIGE